MPVTTPQPVSTPPPVAHAPGLSSIEQIVKVRGRGRRARHLYLKIGLVTIVIGMLLAGGYFGVQYFERWLVESRPANAGSGSGDSGLVFLIRTKAGANERVFAVNLDRDVWLADKDLKSRLKSIVAYKRSDEQAEAWVSIAVQDFGVRNPRETEMLLVAVDRLRALFSDSLQFNAKLDDAKFSGIDCWRTTFKGRLGAVQWNGEAYLVPHHGFGYWILVAAPTIEEAQQHIAEFDDRRAIALVTDRRGWTDQPPEPEVYASTDCAFAVHTRERVWNKNDPKKSEDENAVLFLSGHFHSLGNPGPEAGTAKNATLIAVAIDKKTDLGQAFSEVRKYLERKKQEESKEYQFAPIDPKTDAKARYDGELGEVGAYPGMIGEMKLQRGTVTTRYVMLAVFNDGAKSYGLRFECAWDNREVWRREFQDVIKSVRAAK